MRSVDHISAGVRPSASAEQHSHSPNSRVKTSLMWVAVAAASLGVSVPAAIDPTPQGLAMSARRASRWIGIAL